MNNTLHEELLQTYPIYNGAMYTMVWNHDDTITITSSMGKEYCLEYDKDELIYLLGSSPLPLEDAINELVYNSVPIDNIEAIAHGRLSFSTSTDTWQIVSKRPHGYKKTAFVSHFTKEDFASIRNSWDEKFDPAIFDVTNEDLLLEISSKTVPATHCLVSESILSQIVEKFYDMSEETEILLTSDQSSIFIGHKNAIERLYTPGSGNIIKSYQKMKKEVWG